MMVGRSMRQEGAFREAKSAHMDRNEETIEIKILAFLLYAG